MAEFVAENFETGADASSLIGDTGGTDYWTATKITVSPAIVCSATSIYLQTRDGSVVGDLTFRLETDDGGEPSGTLAHANATGTIANASITDNAWNKKSFTQFALAADTYWLVMSVPAQANNVRLNWTADADGGTNTRAYSGNGGSSWTVDNYAQYFRLYGILLEVSVNDSSSLTESIGRKVTSHINVHDCGETKDIVGG